jgi:hypothetical protein
VPADVVQRTAAAELATPMAARPTPRGGPG